MRAQLGAAQRGRVFYAAPVRGVKNRRQERQARLSPWLSLNETYCLGGPEEGTMMGGAGKPRERRLNAIGDYRQRWRTGVAGKNWQIEGKYVEYCSCDQGCPCESMADPTYGSCTGLVAFKIDKGHCEDVRLDDLAVVGAFYFPRAIHHGQGVFQPVLDERADEAQRSALFYILSGEDQPVGTMFQIFSVIVETIKDPLFAKIEFDWDLDKRSAKIDIANVLQAHSEPIRNPVTNKEHRMISVLPEGWVFHEAENASGFAKGLGAIKFDLKGRHSSLAHIAWNQNGLVHLR
jgi:hypothetical protein